MFSNLGDILNAVSAIPTQVDTGHAMHYHKMEILQPKQPYLYHASKMLVSIELSILQIHRIGQDSITTLMGSK
jgi:hypothetical protein